MLLYDRRHRWCIIKSNFSAYEASFYLFNSPDAKVEFHDMIDASRYVSIWANTSTNLIVTCGGENARLILHVLLIVIRPLHVHTLTFLYRLTLVIIKGLTSPVRMTHRARCAFGSLCL